MSGTFSPTVNACVGSAGRRKWTQLPQEKVPDTFFHARGREDEERLRAALRTARGRRRGCFRGGRMALERVPSDARAFFKKNLWHGPSPQASRQSMVTTFHDSMRSAAQSALGKTTRRRAFSAKQSQFDDDASHRPAMSGVLESCAGSRRWYTWAIVFRTAGE